MENIDTVSLDQLQKLRLNFVICTNQDVAPLKLVNRVNGHSRISEACFLPSLLLPS